MRPHRLAPSKAPSDARLVRLRARLDQYRQEEAAYGCLLAIETFEHPTSAVIPDRPEPSFDVASAESALECAKSKNSINPPDPDNTIVPMTFRPPERRLPFRVSSVIDRKSVV
jgi:hypothetical protein